MGGDIRRIVWGEVDAYDIFTPKKHDFSWKFRRITAFHRIRKSFKGGAHGSSFLCTLLVVVNLMGSKF